MKFYFLLSACLCTNIAFGGPKKDMIHGDELLQSVYQHDRLIDDSLLQIKSMDELSKKQMEWKKILLDMLGGLPSSNTPLHGEITRTVSLDGCKLEYILFQSSPGVYVTAYLYLPDSPKFRPPYSTVLSLNGHTDIGKRGGKYRLMPIMLVKEGFAVFCPDPISQGERVQRKAEYPLSGCATEHMSIGARSWLVGWNFARFRLHDAIRSIDYLESRKDLDISRLSVIGCSGGGTMSTLTQAMEPRIKVACPASYVSSMREVVRERGIHDAEQFFFGQLPRGFNHAVLLAMGMPRTAFCIFARQKDYFPLAGSRSTAEVIRTVKKNLGLDSAFDIYDCEGPHGWAISQMYGTISWLNCYQKNKQAKFYTGEKGFDVKTLHKIPDRLIKPDDPCLPKLENNGNVTENGSVRELPGFKSLYEIIEEEALRLQKLRKIDRNALPEIVRRRAAIRPLDQLGPEPPPFRHPFDWWYLEGPEGHRIEQKAAILAVEGRSLIGERAESYLRKALEEQKKNGRKPVALEAEGVWCIAAAHAYAAEPQLFSSVKFINPPTSWTEMLKNPDPGRDSFAVTVWGALKEYDWTDLVPAECLTVEKGKNDRRNSTGF